MITSRSLDGTTYQVHISELHWRPAAYVVVIDQDRILLTKQMGAYHLPGGGIELGETPEQAAIREVKEETGIIVAAPALIEVQSSYFSHEEDNGEIAHVQALMLFYHCQRVGGEITTEFLDKWESLHAEPAEWIPLNRLTEIQSGSTFDWKKVVSKVSA